MKLFKIMETAYDNFDSSVNSYINKVFNSLGISNTNSQIFSLIFNAIKGIMQNAMFYIEDALTEQNIFTASRKKSIYNLAKISGYEPFFGSAANGSIIARVKRGAILDNNSTKLFIPNKTQLLNKTTGITYNLILSSNNYVIDISKPLMQHEFKIVEGRYHVNRFYAIGNEFETINVESSLLFDKSFVTVKVNGEEYEIYDSIYDMYENKKQCVVSIGYDNTFSVIFGNGINGKKLEAGDNIVIEWLSHQGKQGNILTSEKSNFIFYTAGKDIFGNSINLNSFIDLSVLNCISGGIDADDINTIKNMIGFNSRSLVLTSPENFKLFFKRFSFVGKVNCWMPQNSLKIFISCITNAIDKSTTPEIYFKIPKDSLYLNNDQEHQIVQSLNNSNKLFAGISIEFIKPIIRRYAIICFIKEDDVFNKEIIKESIRNSLANFFINLPDNTTVIYKSDLISKILNECEHIKFIDLNIISEVGEETYKNTYYNKYSLVNIDNNYHYTSTKVFYELENTPGLDSYGNISLDSILETPLLQGGFPYYPNKDINDRNTSINIETIQFYFI